MTDNRSGRTSRVTSEGGPAEFRLQDTVVSSEGGPEQDTMNQEITTQRKNKVREKWKRKLINRLKAKQKKAQDKRNWGMAKAVTRGEAWDMIKNENLNDLPNASTIFDNKKIRRQVEFAISDWEPWRTSLWKERQSST